MSLGEVTRAKGAIQQKWVSHRPWPLPGNCTSGGTDPGLRHEARGLIYQETTSSFLQFIEKPSRRQRVARFCILSALTQA